MCISKSRRRRENLGRIEAIRFPIREFDRDDARAVGAIRAETAASGRIIGPYDPLIAGQAVARELTLVSRSARESERVTGPPLDDWKD